MTPKLYYAPGTCALAPHICFEEAGAVVDFVRVDLAGGEHHGPEYLKLNPNARVPLTEAAAIMGWIARTWPDAHLAPSGDAWAEAQVQSFNSFLTSSVHASSFGAIFRPGRFSDDPALHPAIKAKGLATLKGQFAQIEDRLQPGAWVHGAYSTSDPYLLVMARWYVRLHEDLGAFPRIAAHAERMLERPAVKAAFEVEGIVFG
jgi:glutathione S-transferase